MTPAMPCRNGHRGLNKNGSLWPRCAFSDDGINCLWGMALTEDPAMSVEGPFSHFNAILCNPVATTAPRAWARRGASASSLVWLARMTALGASQARVPRAAVDGIDLVCPQVHSKVHMRDLPPPRETRSAAALIGVMDIGHIKSEPEIASFWGWT